MPRITITIEGQTPQPYRFGLDRESVTFGRGDDNDIIIDCGSVSLQHAVMKRVPGGYELQDLGSTNGIRLDDEYQQVISLHNGQSVLLGDVDFDFLLGDEELEQLATEQQPATGLPEIAYEEPPAPAAPEAAAPQSVPPGGEPEKTGQVGLNTLVAVLAFIAFLVGMAINYQQDTGGSLLKAVQTHIGGSGQSPAPDSDDADQ